jgi:hypothetical protein
VSGRAETPAPSTVGVLLTTPWDETIVLPGHTIRTELYGGLTPITVDGVSLDNGFYVTPQLPRPEDVPPPPGPAQTLVRVAWAEEVVRLPAFLPWSTVATAGDVPLTLGAPLVPGPRAWALPYTSELGPDRVVPIAATVQLAGDGTHQLAVISYDRNTRRLDRRLVTAPSAAAVVIVGGQVFSLITAGWAVVGTDGLAPAANQGQVGVGPATEIHNVRNCAGTGGLLVRRLESPPLPPDTTQDEVYTGYDAVGVLAAEDTPLAALATELNAAGERVLGAACVTLDASGTARAEAVVLSRGAGIGLRARLLSDATTVVELPNVTAIATFLNASHVLAAGVETTIDGPHVQSYKLAELAQPDGSLAKSFVTTSRVFARLADQAGSIDVSDLDGALDENGATTMDVVAAINTPVGPLLQVSLGRIVDGERLSAVTALLPGGRDTTNPVLRFLDLDGVGGTNELVVMTDQYVLAFCPNPASMKAVCAAP